MLDKQQALEQISSLLSREAPQQAFFEVHGFEIQNDESMFAVMKGNVLAYALCTNQHDLALSLLRAQPDLATTSFDMYSEFAGSEATLHETSPVSFLAIESPSAEVFEQFKAVAKLNPGDTAHKVYDQGQSEEKVASFTLLDSCFIPSERRDRLVRWAKASGVEINHPSFKQEAAKPAKRPLLGM